MADYESGSSYDFTGQRQMNPMLAKLRRGLQFGLSTYSPYENPSERDARARELLAGYGEGLERVGTMGVSAGQSEWSRVRAGEGRGSETSSPVNQLRLMGLRDREPSRGTSPPPAPAPSGYKPEGYDVDLYGNLVPISERIKAISPSQWSEGPGITKPKPLADRASSITTSSRQPRPGGLSMAERDRLQPRYGVNTYTGQMVDLSRHGGTKYSPGYFETALPSSKQSSLIWGEGYNAPSTMAAVGGRGYSGY